MKRHALELNPIVRLGLALLVACFCGVLKAQVPYVLNYQGCLTTPTGNPPGTIGTAQIVNNAVASIAVAYRAITLPRLNADSGTGGATFLSTNMILESCR